MNQLSQESLNNKDDDWKPAEKQKHFFWDNWKILSICANICFSTANVLIGEISDLGMRSTHYFCSGALMFSLFYFMYQKECCRRNIPDDESKSSVQKVLLRTWDNKFDWHSMLVIILMSVIQFAIYTSIWFTFQVSHKANLNIGIAQAIWGVTPFLVCVLERIFIGTTVKTHHIFGMTIMVICVVTVSISDVIFTDEEELSKASTSVEDEEEPSLPIWKAVAASLIPPVAISCHALYANYVSKNVRLSSYDFTIAYWGLIALVFQIVAVIFFTTNSDDEVFDVKLWTKGTIASFLNVLGSAFCIASFSTGSPMGPIVAIVDSQTILITPITSIMARTMPTTLQLIGLIIGILGALILTIPDHMYDLWYLITRCRRHDPSDESAGNAKTTLGYQAPSDTAEESASSVKSH